jgi:E3 ubiquitin ligase SMURF1/2
VPGGANKLVTKQNLEQFIELLVMTRFEEGAKQIQWIREGVFTVIPKTILNMLTWEEIEIRAVGNKILDLDLLKKITDYQCCDENSQVVKFFWSALEEMDEKEKQLYL